MAAFKKLTGFVLLILSLFCFYPLSCVRQVSLLLPSALLPYPLAGLLLGLSLFLLGVVRPVQRPIHILPALLLGVLGYILLSNSPAFVGTYRADVPLYFGPAETEHDFLSMGGFSPLGMAMLGVLPFSLVPARESKPAKPLAWLLLFVCMAAALVLDCLGRLAHLHFTQFIASNNWTDPFRLILPILSGLAILPFIKAEQDFPAAVFLGIAGLLGLVFVFFSGPVLQLANALHIGEFAARILDATVFAHSEIALYSALCVAAIYLALPSHLAPRIHQ